MVSVGILTAGGDCPGLNAVIRGVVTQAEAHSGQSVVGIRNGWEGLMENRFVRLTRDDVRGILPRGGTILGSSRRDPFVHGDGAASVQECIDAAGIRTLIVVGGDGTLRTALRIAEETDVNVIGVPKTVDKDISLTDVTLGFHTAVEIATDAVDRLTTTAESHNRVAVIEVMGRTQGWIATYAGIAGGAEAILIPEVPYDLEAVASGLRVRHQRGRSFSVIVVAEGVDPPSGDRRSGRKDAFGFERLGGVAYQIAPRIEELTGFEARVTVLGHVQRGGTPNAFDRVLGTRLGVAAFDAAAEGASDVMVAVQRDEMVLVPLAEACMEVLGVDDGLYDVASAFFN